MVKRMIPYNLGICQGRLTMPPNGELQWFPEQKWINEFKIAKNLGYDFIELLVEREHNQREIQYGPKKVLMKLKVILENIP